jgi:hypothetical protein
LELLAPHVVELGLNRLPYLQPVLNRGHLQPSLQNLLPVHIRKPRMLPDRLRVLLESQPLLRVLRQQLFD